MDHHFDIANVKQIFNSPNFVIPFVLTFYKLLLLTFVHKKMRPVRDRIFGSVVVVID